MKRKWKVIECSDRANIISRKLGIPVEVASYLEHCGIDTEVAAKSHLSPELASMRTPWDLKDMGCAVERLVRAVRRREIIGIFGDYDADGVSSVALLALFFRAIQQPYEIYIPHRELDGYGLNIQGLRYLQEKGATLIVTVDCGVTAISEVAEASSMGMDVIVTDHHETLDTLPECTAVIDPKRRDCRYYFDGLAGVGVAFNLIVALRAALREQGLFSRLPEPNLKEFLDLVTIGTIGDVVPLRNENRIFTRIGLEVIRNSNRPGIQALLTQSNVKGAPSVVDVAFRMVPRINAAGRMDHAQLALQLFMSEDWEDAVAIAAQLNMLNAKRQRIEQDIFQEAFTMAQGYEDDPIIILANHNWKKGVIGIVASKLMDRIKRPVILLTQEADGMLEGSGRSPSQVNLIALLKSCALHLEGFGGHSCAAGLRLRFENLEAFRQSAKSYMDDLAFSAEDSLTVHMDLSIEGLLSRTFQDIYGRLEPFGPGCEAPLVRLSDFECIDHMIVGKNHLKLYIASRNNRPLYASRPIEVLGWGLGAYKDIPWHEVEIACSPFFNHWNGSKNLQLELKDVRPSKNEA